MQIVALAVYSHNGEMRRVDFKLRSLNILTGESETGKSTVGIIHSSHFWISPLRNSDGWHGGKFSTIPQAKMNVS